MGRKNMVEIIVEGMHLPLTQLSAFNASSQNTHTLLWQRILTKREKRINDQLTNSNLYADERINEFFKGLNNYFLEFREEVKMKACLFPPFFLVWGDLGRRTAMSQYQFASL